MKRFFLPLIAILFIASCKKDSSIGADILPGTDLLNIHSTDTFTVKAKTIADTFLRTDKLARNFLGQINDPTFGVQKAGIVMELDKPDLVYDDTLGPFTVDSVVLFLKYLSVYGDTTVPQNFTASTINNKIDENQAFYSNSTNFPASSLIGSLSNYYIQPSHFETRYPGDSIGLQALFRMKINSYVGYSILNLGETVLNDSLLFKNSFPGIRVENSGSNGNAMIEVNTGSTASYLDIFYKNKYGAQKEMRMNTNIYNFSSGIIDTRQNGVNLFNTNFSSAVQNVINSGNVNDTVNYIEGQGATLVRVSMPTIDNIGKVAVNKAVLQVAQIQQNPNDLRIPDFLILLKRNSDGHLDILSSADGLAVADTTGSDLSGNKIAIYNFNITQYVEKISKGLETNGDVFIATYRYAGIDGTYNALNSNKTGTVVNFSYSPARLVVAGPGYSDARYRMKLNVIYSLIK